MGKKIIDFFIYYFWIKVGKNFFYVLKKTIKLIVYSVAYIVYLIPSFF